MLNESAALVHKNLTMHLSSFECSQQPPPPFTDHNNHTFTAGPCPPQPSSGGSQEQKNWLTLKKTNVPSWGWHEVTPVCTEPGAQMSLGQLPLPRCLVLTMHRWLESSSPSGSSKSWTSPLIHHQAYIKHLVYT